MQTKQTKRRAIILSLFVILLCLAVIVGATLAAFSEKKEYGIGVTAGKVKYEGTLSIEKVWSAGEGEKIEEVRNKTSSITGDGITASTEQGFTASTNAETGKISLSKMAQGDGATFKLTIANESTIKTKYSVSIRLNTGSTEDDLTFAKKLAIVPPGYTVDNSFTFGSVDSVIAIRDWTEWTTTESTAAGTGSTPTTEILFDICFPWVDQDVDLGSGALDFIVELDAVQSNAATGPIASGAANYESLNEAFEGVNSGDTIMLGETSKGTEVTWFSAEQLNKIAESEKQVVIEGSGKEETVIVPEKTTEPANNTIYVPTNVTLKNVKLDGDVELPKAANTETTLENTTITGDLTVGKEQISRMAASNVTATGGTFTFDGVTIEGKIEATDVNLTLNNCTQTYALTTGENLGFDANNANRKGILIVGSNVAINGGTYTYGLGVLTGIYSSGCELTLTDVTINGHEQVTKSPIDPDLIQLGEGSSTTASTLTINGGTYTAYNRANLTKVRHHGISVFDRSTVNLKGATFQTSGPVYASNGSNQVENYLNIESGSYTTMREVVAFYLPAKTTMEMTGGTIMGATALDLRSGTINITGGTLIGRWTGEQINTLTPIKGTYRADGSVIILNGQLYEGGLSVNIGENVVLQGGLPEGAGDNAPQTPYINVYTWGDKQATFEYTIASNHNVRYFVPQNGTATLETTLATLVENTPAGGTINLVHNNHTPESVTVNKNLTINVEEGVVYKASITVAAGATLTVTGEGTLQGVSDHTLTNNGTLTVSGTVTVDNIMNGKGAVVNNAGASFTMDGGTLTRSQAKGDYATDKPNGNSWYTLNNEGNAVINNGTISMVDGYSSLICNYGPEVPATLTINNGTFSGGLNTIKNDENGVLVIEDGTFTNASQHCIMNCNQATINGGEYSVSDTAVYAISMSLWIEDSNPDREITEFTKITGGEFHGGLISTDKYYPTYHGAYVGSKAKWEITGGIFDKEYHAVVHSKAQLTTFLGKELNVKLGSDIEVGTAGSTFAGVYITNKTLSIDLNGHTIKYIGDNPKSGTGGKAIRITGTSNVTIFDSSEAQTGKVDAGTGTSVRAIALENSAKVTIKSGTYTAGGEGNSCILIQNNGSVVIEGGTFSTAKPYEGKYYVLNVNNDATGTFTVYGGTFVGQNPEDGDDSIGKSYLADGYSSVYVGEVNGVKVWEVVKDTVVTSEQTLREAIDGGAKSIVLGNAITVESKITISDSLKLDLGGYALNLIKSNGTDKLLEIVGGNVVIANGSLEGSGEDSVVQAQTNATVDLYDVNINSIESVNKYAFAVWANGGTINIYGGEFTQTITGSDKQYDLIYASDSGSINVYGGTFKCNTPGWTLNCKNNTESRITVYGGSFYNFDPSAERTNDATDRNDKIEVAEGYKVTSSVVENDTVYTVVPV